MEKQLQLLSFLEDFLTEERKLRIQKVLSERTNHFTVAIEDVYHLHNTSAVIRSCDAFGIQEIHVIEKQYGERIDKNIAMGSQKWVDLYRYRNTETCIKKLRAKGYNIIATTPHEKVCVLDTFEIKEKSALFFGTEKNGLSPYILNEADSYLKIPIHGFTNSLNVSVSAAIILQHITSKLKASTINWKLTDETLLEKRIDWAKKSIKSIDSILKKHES